MVFVYFSNPVPASVICARFIAMAGDLTGADAALERALDVGIARADGCDIVMDVLDTARSMREFTSPHFALEVLAHLHAIARSRLGNDHPTTRAVGERLAGIPLNSFKAFADCCVRNDFAAAAAVLDQALQSASEGETIDLLTRLTNFVDFLQQDAKDMHRATRVLSMLAEVARKRLGNEHGVAHTLAQRLASVETES